MAGKRDGCPVPACMGGCHVCMQVKKQTRERPLFEAACNVLARRDLDVATRMVAEYVRERTRPRVNEATGRWLSEDVAQYRAKLT